MCDLKEIDKCFLSLKKKFNPKIFFQKNNGYKIYLFLSFYKSLSYTRAILFFGEQTLNGEADFGGLKSGDYIRRILKGFDRIGQNLVSLA